MAVVALHSAATGLNAMSQDIDVIANNLANSNTNGYRRLRSNFEDLLYQAKRQPGAENANGDQTPLGQFVGLGTRIASTQIDPTQGSPIAASGDFDMLIEGPGFFKVLVPDSGQTRIGYTRAGNFVSNSEGELVLGNSQGFRLEPPVQIEPGTTGISISADGIISGIEPGNETPTQIGQIELSNFVNPAGLELRGSNVFFETDASGPSIDAEPGEAGVGKIIHKFLESSNVDPVKELVNLIKTQRSFELNSQVIETADEVLQVVANLRR